MLQKATVMGTPATPEQIRDELEALKLKRERLGDQMKKCELELLALLQAKYGKE